jgi:tetratricopeptide (TPR) repeat protein
MTTTSLTSPLKTLIPSGFRPWVFVIPLAAIVSFGCAKGEDTKEQYLARANDYFAAGQYDKAEKEYREVLRLAPEDPVALQKLGVIYLDQGQVIQAYPLLKKSAELQPDDPEIQLRLGTSVFALGALAEARDAALQALEKQPENEQALLLLADASRNPDDIEDARKFIQSLRDKDEDRARYHVALGVLDLRQINAARAESEFKAAINLDPKSSQAYAALGSFYLSRNDLKEAGQAFKTAADLAPLRSPIRVRYADFLLRTGAAAEAKNILDEISQKYPDYLPPRVLLMRIACAERKEEDCAARVQNILAQDAVNYDALFQDGIFSLAKGDAPKALRIYGYLSNTYRLNPQVRYQLALAYLLSAKNANAADSRNAVDRAESVLADAIKLNPRFDQATLLLAELKLRKGNSAAAAVDLLAPLTKERPQIAQAQYLLSRAYLALQKADEALAVYRQMTELFPEDPQPPFLMASILLRQGKQNEARSALEKSLEISPDYMPAIQGLVGLDISAKQYAPALDRVQKLLDTEPKDKTKFAQLSALRGTIYAAQEDFTHAEADLLKAIDLDPNLTSAYLLLAQLYIKTNKQQQAIEKLNESIEKNKNVPALMLLAMLNAHMQHFDAARDAYEKLLTVAPNSPAALNNLAVLYSEQLGQLDKASELAKKAREANPNDAHVADTLGWILFKKGDYDNARPLLQESVSKLPDQPEIQFHAGMAHYMMGEEGPARIALEKAANASADFPGKDEARQRLALLDINVATANPGVRTELENYLRKWPNDPAVLVRLAAIQERDGAADQALKTYEKLLSDYPQFAPALRQLALHYGQRSTADTNAYELAMKARQAYPDDPEIAKALGIINYRRGAYPQAMELLKEAAAKRKDDPQILYYLGALYRELKQYPECKGALERALSLNLSSELGDDAKRALEDCSEMVPQ